MKAEKFSVFLKGVVIFKSAIIYNIVARKALTEQINELFNVGFSQKSI